MRNEIGRPRGVAGLQPASYKVVAAMFSNDLPNQHLVGFRGGRGEGQSNLAETEFEQSIAPAGLAVVVTFRRCASEDLDLAVVQPKPPIDCRDLRLYGAVVGQENSSRTALDDGWRNG